LFMINYTFTAFARNDKAPMHAMIGSIAGSAYNIIFDYVFMFVFGFGFAGAALATVGCPVVTMLVCGFHFAGKNNTIPFSIRRLSIVRLLKCMSVGTSAFIGEFSNGVISAVYNFLVLGLAGNVGVAAYGVIANIALVCVSILNGIAQGLQPLISEAYGYGKKKEVKDLFAFGLVTAIAVSVLFVILSQLFASPLVAVFNKERNESLRALAIPGIRIYFMGFLAAGVNIVLISYFSAIQNVCIVMIGSMLRGLILIALFAFLLSRIFGITGVWMSFAMAESVTLLMIAFMKKHFGGRQFF
jgi:Na+-driven multidrug efflux pump